MYLQSIEDIRKVGDLARSYLWDILIEKGGGAPPPAPFNEWFPAVSVSEPIASIHAEPIPIPINPFNAPRSMAPRQLSVTFVDTQDHRLGKWLENWIKNEIFGGGLYVATLDVACKDITIVKMNHQRQKVSAIKYTCFPVGDPAHDWNSDNHAKTITVNFPIVGETPA